MELFIRAEVPEYCYIHEAAYWIAFCTVPEIHHLEDGRDARDDTDNHLDLFESCTSPTFFPIAGIVSRFLSGADAEHFARNLNITLGASEAEILEQINRLKGLKDQIDFESDEPQHKIFIANLKESEAELSAAREISNTISSLEQLVEIASSKLFGALAQGRITARGVAHWPATSGKYDVINGEFREIPSALWRMKDVDWRKANLGLDQEGSPLFIGVQVAFRDLLKLFPEPDFETTLLTVRDFGGCLVSDAQPLKSASEYAIKNSARKPEKVNILLATAIKNEFSQRIKLGYRPENREQIIQECIVWVKKTFERGISRSTAQRHLAQLNAQIDAALARK